MPLSAGLYVSEWSVVLKRKCGSWPRGRGDRCGRFFTPPCDSEPESFCHKLACVVYTRTWMHFYGRDDQSFWSMCSGHDKDRVLWTCQATVMTTKSMTPSEDVM
jgi:hypothetical protein